jgi:hypothetical protein
MDADKYRSLLRLVEESKSDYYEMIPADVLEENEEIRQFRELVETIYSEDCYYSITRT